MTQDKKKYWEGFDGEEDNDEEDDDEEDFGEEDVNKDPSSLLDGGLMEKIAKKGEEKEEEILNEEEEKQTETCKNAKKGKDFFFAAAFLPLSIISIFLIILLSYVTTRWVFWLRGISIFNTKFGPLNYLLFVLVFALYIGLSIPIVLFLFKILKEVDKLTKKAYDTESDVLVLFNVLKTITTMVIYICLFCMFSMPIAGFFNVIFRAIFKSGWRGGAIGYKSIEDWVASKLDPIEAKIQGGIDAKNALDRLDKLNNDIGDDNSAEESAFGNMFATDDDNDKRKEQENLKTAKSANKKKRDQGDKAKNKVTETVYDMLTRGHYLKLENPIQVDYIFNIIIDEIKKHSLFQGDTDLKNVTFGKKGSKEDSDIITKIENKINKNSITFSKWSFYVKGGKPSDDTQEISSLKSLIEDETEQKMAEMLSKAYVKQDTSDNYSLCCMNINPKDFLRKTAASIAMALLAFTPAIPIGISLFLSFFNVKSDPNIMMGIAGFIGLGGLFIFIFLFITLLPKGKSGVSGFSGSNVYAPMYYKNEKGEYKMPEKGICTPCKKLWPILLWFITGEILGAPVPKLLLYASIAFIFAAIVCWFVWFFSCFGWLEGEEKKDEQQDKTRKNVNNYPILKAMRNEKLITKMNTKVSEDENLDENAKNKYDFNKYLDLASGWEKEAKNIKKLIEEAEPDSKEDTKSNKEYNKYLALWSLSTPDKEQIKEPTTSDIGIFANRTILKNKFDEWLEKGNKITGDIFVDKGMYWYFVGNYKKLQKKEGSFSGLLKSLNIGGNK